MLRMTLCGFVCVLAFALAAPGEEPVRKLKSAEAKKALADYEKAVKLARETFDKEAEAARKKLIAELGAAQEKAAKANDLDDAVLLRDLRKSFEDTGPAPPKDGRLQIVSAFYGANVSWLDVTEKVRQAAKGKAKWSATVSTRDWGDPAPAFNGQRTLIVQYSAGGKLHFKAVYEGKEIVLP